MKNYTLFLVALFLTSSFYAQIIDIPDSNFKAVLIDAGVDTNSDGEIQISEAEARTGTLYFANESVSSIEGIEYFINLDGVYCPDNQISELNLSTLTLLESLTCDNNQLTELTLNSTALTWLQCANNQLTELDITNLPNLQYLYCGNNLLTSLDFSSQSFFWTIDCGNNNLTTLDVTNLEQVYDLILSNNQLTSINLCPISGEYLSVDNNYLTEIDISNSPNLEGIFCPNNLLTSLDISNNNSLINLYASNNELTTLNLGNAESLYFPGDVFFDGNPNLSVICTIEDNFDEVQTLLDEYNYTECTISTYCFFEPNGEYFIVQGETTFDSNNDGCDVSDIAMQNVNYNITNNSINDSFISNTDGTFTLYIDSGSHTIAPNFENPDYFSVSPTSVTVDFPLDTSPFAQDFCITPNGTFNDLEITIIPVEAARPGFDTDYKVIYKNKGTTTLSGNINFGFQDDVMTFLSSTPPNESGLPDLLSWSFTDLVPFESREISLTINLNAPTDTPPLNGGDILNFIASISSSQTDETPDDNVATLNQTIVNSFDPNDKTCLEGDFISPEMVGKYVHYMIRFENTGSANAVNIVVKDHIDITKYGLSTLIPLYSSHDYFARIKDQGNDHYIEFIFENINLPFDDANNDGYIAFKIETLDTLALGDTFENEAEIYFDFNFPIITNTAQTTVATLSMDEFVLGASFSIYPNPTSDVLHIEAKHHIQSVSLYDFTGRLVQNSTVAKDRFNFEISTENLAAGTYFVQIHTSQESLVQQIVKQ